MDREVSEEGRLRRLLPHTWHAFLGRFGGVTPIQARAAGPVVSGESLLVCAPTASGKTEALLAPLVERLIRQDRHLGGIRLLVICPTRALCNDLHRRVEKPLSRCGWDSGIKSGDSPRLIDSDRPSVVVTTPESLDSILARQPRRLRSVGAIVLDELHLLDGRVRGDQLQMLVKRLGQVAPGLQVCGASATAARSDVLARRFASEDAGVVEVRSGRDRQIDMELVQALDLREAAAIIEELARGTPGAKWLIFCNRRDEVEYLSAHIEGVEVFAHHGSLSRGERLRVEERFLNAPQGLCAATMTLELGVDIGDVDQVVCINPPPNVASFSQRIGRGNRRGERLKVLGLYVSGFDRARFEHLADCARRGQWFGEEVAFRPSVIAQQAVSLMHQNPRGWISARALHGRLPDAIGSGVSVGDCEAILAAMRDEGYLYGDSRGRFVADEQARLDYERGQMHSHITSAGEVEIIDEATGRRLGTAAPDGEAGLLLAGRHREVTRVTDKQIFVGSSDDDKEPKFISRMGPRYSYGLARDLARFLGHGPGEMPMDRVGESSWMVGHFMGSLWGQCTAMVMRKQGFRVKSVGAFELRCRWPKSGDPPTGFGDESSIEAWMGAELRRGYRRFLSRLEVGPWGRFVPEEQLRRWVEESLDIESFAEALSSFKRVERR